MSAGVKPSVSSGRHTHTNIHTHRGPVIRLLLTWDGEKGREGRGREEEGGGSRREEVGPRGGTPSFTPHVPGLPPNGSHPEILLVFHNFHLKIRFVALNIFGI